MALLALPTTTVSIKRGTTIDDYEGTITNETTVASGVSASIMEQVRQNFEPVTGLPRTIRFITGRVSDGTDVLTNDRLLDEVEGSYYTVISVRQMQNPVVTMDVTLELKRVGSTIV